MWHGSAASATNRCRCKDQRVFAPTTRGSNFNIMPPIPHMHRREVARLVPSHAWYPKATDLRRRGTREIATEFRRDVRGTEVERTYPITLSAAISSAGEIVRPSALAVLLLITRSILVGNSTGSSAGSVSPKILST